MIDYLSILVYLVAIIPCARAMQSARRHEVPRNFARYWQYCIVALLALAAFRLFGIENAIRTASRLAIERHGDYMDRREFQAPLAAAAILFGGGLIFLWWRWQPRGRIAPGSRQIWLSKLGLMGYIPLMAVRLISFHSTDQLLYGKGFHLNWVLDVALIGTIALPAIGFVARMQQVRRRGSPKERHHRR